MTYYIYHIPGKKIGVTRDLKKRVEEQQGYEPGEYSILMKSNNISIIVISHNLEHVFKLADRIAIMKNGEMINIVNTSTTNRESVVKLITFGQT